MLTAATFAPSNIFSTASFTCAFVASRHRGGGSKIKYRIIDFKRNKDGVPALVKAIEYDHLLIAISRPLLSDFYSSTRCRVFCVFISSGKLHSLEDFDILANIPEVKTASVSTINVYDLLKYNTLVVTKDAVAKIEEVYA